MAINSKFEWKKVQTSEQDVLKKIAEFGDVGSTGNTITDSNDKGIRLCLAGKDMNTMLLFVRKNSNNLGTLKVQGQGGVAGKNITTSNIGILFLGNSRFYVNNSVKEVDSSGVEYTGRWVRLDGQNIDLYAIQFDNTKK